MVYEIFHGNPRFRHFSGKKTNNLGGLKKKKTASFLPMGSWGPRVIGFIDLKKVMMILSGCFFYFYVNHP